MLSKWPKMSNYYLYFHLLFQHISWVCLIQCYEFPHVNLDPGQSYQLSAIEQKSQFKSLSSKITHSSTDILIITSVVSKADLISKPWEKRQFDPRTDGFRLGTENPNYFMSNFSIFLIACRKKIYTIFFYIKPALSCVFLKI